MSNDEKTNLFVTTSVKHQEVRRIIGEVYDALEERGYNAVNQIVGYLISGDPGYISSYRDSRNKILELDRTEIVEVLLDSFCRKEKWDI